MCNPMEITIIYLDNSVLMSKKNYQSWRSIQDEYDTYKASLTPDSPKEIINYLELEYPNLEPSAKTQIKDFLNSPNETVLVTFNE